MPNNLLDDFNSVDGNAKVKLQQALGASSPILWADRPMQGLNLSRASIPMGCFGTFWTVFSGFIFLLMLIVSDDLFPLFLSGGFVLIGLFLTFGHPFYDRKIRQKTYYGFTKENIVILTNEQLQKISLDSIVDLEIKVGKNNIGQIEFLSAGDLHRSKKNSQVLLLPHQFKGFRLIRNPEQVYDHLQEIIQKR